MGLGVGRSKVEGLREGESMGKGEGMRENEREIRVCILEIFF